MSNDMVPCIAFALSGLARKQGSLDEVVRMPGLVQVERFQTFRNSPAGKSALDDTGNAAPHDNTQLIAWVMDSRCRIRVFFDVEATNRIEKMTGERVTSYLRSLVYLKEYKFVILPPSDALQSKKDYSKSSHRKLPELVLHVYDWQKYIGSSDDPLYHEEAEYLLSNFLSYSLDGNDGRVPKGYGVTADEVIWRKQENEALGFVRNEWEKLQATDPPEQPNAEESTEEHLLEAPYRHVLMSMLQSMEPEKERVVENIKVFGINPLEELDVMEIAQVLLDNAVNVIPDTPPHAKSLVRKEPEEPWQAPPKKACRKSTGRKLPQARRSLSTSARPPELLATQALVTQHLLTQKVLLQSTIELRDSPSRRESNSPEHEGSRHITSSKGQEATTKQGRESNERRLYSPGTSMLYGAGSDGKDMEIAPEKQHRSSKLETGRRLSIHHVGDEKSKSSAKNKESNASDILRNLSSPPSRPMSSPQALMNSKYRPKGPAHPSASASQHEASSPVPLPSSQKATRTDRDEEDSDMDQDGPQGAQPTRRQSSNRYLFELDDDEDGLYEFEVAEDRAELLEDNQL